MYMHDRISKGRTRCRFRQNFRGRSGRSGYILEQLLISLAICAFLIPVAAAILAILLSSLHQPLLSQDEVGIAQLRHVINSSCEYQVDGSSVRFLHRKQQQHLHLVNGNLVLTNPGTQIFLTDLDECSFSERGGLLYVTYSHPNKEQVSRCIGYIAEPAGEAPFSEES